MRGIVGTAEASGAASARREFLRRYPWETWRADAAPLATLLIPYELIGAGQLDDLRRSANDEHGHVVFQREVAAEVED